MKKALPEEAQAQMQAWMTRSKWRTLRWEIARRDGFRCRLRVSKQCRRLLSDRFEIDHIIPRKDMTSIDQFWDPENLRLVCSECHAVHSGRQNMVEDAHIKHEVAAFDALLGR